MLGNDLGIPTIPFHLHLRPSGTLRKKDRHKVVAKAMYMTAICTILSTRAAVTSVQPHVPWNPDPGNGSV